MRNRLSVSWWWLLLLTLGLGIVACGRSSLASATTTARAALDFPAKTPSWFVMATQQEARGLGDPTATLVEMRLGRFPIVVIHGNFRCGSCPVPRGAALPTGHYATLTFDAVTHRVHDFGLSPLNPGKLAALCPGDCAPRRKIMLASAQQALDASGAAVIVGDQRGSHHCLLSTHETESGFISATCGVAIVFGKQQTSVTLTETWTGLDSAGRRYSADSPVLSHVWQVIETPDGWVTKLSSTGDPPPR